MGQVPHSHWHTHSVESGPCTWGGKMGGFAFDFRIPSSQLQACADCRFLNVYEPLKPSWAGPSRGNKTPIKKNLPVVTKPWKVPSDNGGPGAEAWLVCKATHTETLRTQAVMLHAWPPGGTWGITRTPRHRNFPPGVCKKDLQRSKGNSGMQTNLSARTNDSEPPLLLIARHHRNQQEKTSGVGKNHMSALQNLGCQHPRVDPAGTGHGLKVLTVSEVSPSLISLKC